METNFEKEIRDTLAKSVTKAIFALLETKQFKEKVESIIAEQEKPSFKDFANMLATGLGPAIQQSLIS